MAEEIVFSDLLKQAEASGYTFSALPANEYDTKIASAEVRQTGTGKNKIVVRFQVTSGPFSGRTVFNDFVLSPGNPNAMVIFFRQMAAMGLDGSYFAQNPPLSKVAADLNGREQRLRLGIRNWQGVDRNSVLQIMAPAGGGNGVPGGPVVTGTVLPPPVLPQAHAEAAPPGPPQPASPEPQAQPQPQPTGSTPPPMPF